MLVLHGNQGMRTLSCESINTVLLFHIKEMQYMCILLFTSEPADFFLKKKNVDLVDFTFFVESFVFPVPLGTQSSCITNKNKIHNNWNILTPESFV